jgi:uncharacterized protein YdaU (DUF1376 family)
MSDTWMPFYVGDYLSATTRLTTEQHGAYVLLLLDYWKNGPPPNDDAVLANIARMSPASWRKAKVSILCFFEERDGSLIQKRVEKERQRTAEIIEERRKAGKRGAEKRWNPNAKRNGKRIANANDLPKQTQRQNDAPSPSHGSNEPIESSNEDLSVCTDAPASEEEVLEAWQTRMVPLGFPRVNKMTDDRRRALKARLREYPDIEDWQRALDG